MAGYDILMIAVLAGTTLWGAFKGAAWQLAALASLVASYFASYYLSDSLTSSGLFGQTAPWNRFAAMLTIYIVTGIVIWMGFRVISETIEKIKLKDFDRQLGALLGLFKGLIFCLLITFFVVTLLPDKREQVINTRSGRYVTKLLHKADALVPPELHEVLEPYIKRFEENMQPSNVIDPATGQPYPAGHNPQPWSTGMPNLPSWGNSANSGNFGNQPNLNAQEPSAGSAPGYGNQPRYQLPSSGNGYPGAGPLNPNNGAGGQPAYSNPPLQPFFPQQSPYPQSFRPTSPGIDQPRYN